MDTATLVQLGMAGMLGLVAFFLKDALAKLNKLITDTAAWRLEQANKDAQHQVVQAELRAAYAALDARLTKMESKE